MVSKVAVIALVAVLAVPILLGYGLNLSEVTDTTYTPNKDVTNVTPLLQNSVGYTYVNADPYELNSNFTTEQDIKVMPLFAERTTNTTSYPGWRTFTNSFDPAGRSYNLGSGFFKAYYMQFDYDVNNGSVTGTLTSDDGNNGTITTTITRYHSLYYDESTNIADYSYYNSDGTLSANEISSPKILSFTTSNPTFRVKMQYYNISGTTDFIDLSKGYYFDGSDTEPYNVHFPQMTKSTLFTINLNSITSSTYRMGIDTNISSPVSIVKTSSGWAIDHSGERTPIYFDSSISDNTYQILIEYAKVGVLSNPTRNVYDTHIQFRYVGHWPTLIGTANYYQTYDIHSTITPTSSVYLDKLTFYPSGYTRTPIVRIDSALYPGFEYPVIEENDYDPSAFKDNPVTTFSNITKYGTSIEFAGNTYDVDNGGNIMLGVHKTSLNGLRLESVPVATGYENRINGNLISVSANPSIIGFNGSWALSVSTDSQTVTTYTHTEWIPGEFAWNGIDQNFLIVGLITCLGVFIALGIYLRKTKSSLWPLLIVCGCAAALFFCMI